MDEYRLPVSVDIDKLINDLRGGVNILSETNEAAKKTSQTIKDSFNDAAKSVEDANKVIGQSAGAYNASKNSLAQLTDALLHYKEIAFTEKDITKLKQYNQEVEKIKTQIERLGTVGTNSYKNQTGQIERMNTAISLYRDFVTKATNTDQIVKYNKKIEETTEAVKKLGNAGKKGFDDMGNALENTTKSTGGLISGFKSIASAFGVFLGVQGLVTLGRSLFTTANEVAGVDRAFTNLNRPDLLPKLREETRGFINDFELERLTVRANNFNIPLDRMGTLLLFATQRAKETGESVDKLTEDIISGLGRKSIRIIDNLGISAVEVQKEFKKVGDFTTAVTNIIEREMGRAGVAVDTLADKTQRTGTKFSNFWKETASAVVGFFNKDVADNEVIQQKITQITKQIGDVSKLNADERKKAIADQLAQISVLTKKYTDTQRTAAQSYSFSVDKIAQKNKAITDTKIIGEELAARQAVLQILNKQNRNLSEQARIQKGLTSDVEKQAKVEEIRGRVSNFVVGITGTQAEKTALIKQANDLQAIIDQSNAKAESKREKAEESAAAKAKRRAEKVAAERLRLTNQITQAEAEASDDKTKVEIERENAKFEVAKTTLEKQKTDFPELVKVIDQAIEAEKIAHGARMAIITKKQTDDQAKILADGQKAIAKVLSDDNEEQLKAIDERFNEVRAKAKAAGLLTAEVEAKLAKEQAQTRLNLRVKIDMESNRIAQEMELAGIESRKKITGESEKEFELRNQKDILDIKIKYAEAALKLIENDPAKALDTAKLKGTIEALKKDVLSVSKDIENEKTFSFSNLLQKSLGLDDDGLDNMKKAAGAFVSLFDGIADSIIGSYQREIDAGQDRIDALKEQLDEANSYFDEQNELKEKGYANDSDAAQKNVDAIKASLAQEEQARQDNIKRQQEAQKIVATIRAAEIAGNTIEQVSNLATAASKIFKAHAGIPFAGVVIALGAIAAMVAGFLAIKASIKSATAPTQFKKGGKVGGKTHDEGGNKYRSMDGNDPSVIEIERDEFIINANSTAKHEKLIDAINRDDFSGLNLSDYSLKELLKGTGVSDQSDVARSLGRETVSKQESADAKVIIIQNQDSSHLGKISKGVQKLVKFEEEKDNVTDMGDHFIIKRGNTIEKQWKKK